MKPGGSISIWFFIGISLLVNGVLILGSGIYEYLHPPLEKVVLFNLHASIWWGAILAVLGAIYSYFFSPGRTQG
ncbi:MAG TPA: hypothetical protein VII25_03750 [Candidatus Acidoferrum sp.]|jgi:hypothetical protein